MKKIIKAVVLTVLVGMPVSMQALDFCDLVALWLVAKTVERIAGVTDGSNHCCCACECKKNAQCRVRCLLKNKKIPVKMKSEQ